MTVWAVLWLAWIAVGLGYEVWAIRNKTSGDTLSENLRVWFRVRSNLGRIVFVVVTGCIFAWLIPHILGVNF